MKIIYKYYKNIFLLIICTLMHLFSESKHNQHRIVISSINSIILSKVGFSSSYGIALNKTKFYDGKKYMVNVLLRKRSVFFLSSCKADRKDAFIYKGKEYYKKYVESYNFPSLIRVSRWLRGRYMYTYKWYPIYRHSCSGIRSFQSHWAHEALARI